MSENLRRFVTAAYAMDAVVRRAPSTAWDSPSPCTEWTAREVLGHVIWGMRTLTAIATGTAPPPVEPEATIAGDDPAAAWGAALDAAIEALDRPGALARIGQGPFGETTVDGFLGFFPTDVLAHTWDVARAVCVEPHLPAELCGRAAAGLAAAGDLVRRPGLMGPAIDVPDDADPVTRFIALTGRRP